MKKQTKATAEEEDRSGQPHRVRDKGEKTKKQQTYARQVSKQKRKRETHQAFVSWHLATGRVVLVPFTHGNQSAECAEVTTSRNSTFYGNCHPAQQGGFAAADTHGNELVAAVELPAEISRPTSEDERDEDPLSVLPSHDVEPEPRAAFLQDDLPRLSAKRMKRGVKSLRRICALYILPDQAASEAAFHSRRDKMGQMPHISVFLWHPQ